jgi:colicin import membrane protein
VSIQTFTLKSSGWLSGALTVSILTAALALNVTSALAQDTGSGSNNKATQASTATLLSRFPAGSINSVETADSALEQAAKERSAIEAKFASEERECYQRFFMNNCIDAAKERQRQALKQVRPVEIEANAFKRQERVIERDQALAEKAAQEEREKPLRLQQQQENEAAAAQKAAKAAQEEKEKSLKLQQQQENEAAAAQKAAKANQPKSVERQSGSDQRSAQHEAKLKQLQAQEVANAQQRAANVAAYEKKVREAQEHQRQVEAKKQEKERQRANKAASPQP